MTAPLGRDPTKGRVGETWSEDPSRGFGALEPIQATPLEVGESGATSSYFADREGLPVGESRAFSMELVGTGG